MSFSDWFQRVSLGLSRTRKCRIPLLIVLGLVALPFLAIGPEFWSPRTVPPEAQEANGSQHATANQYATAKADQPQDERSLWVPTSPTELFTLYIAALTGVLAVSTVGLWIVTALGVFNQWNDTRILQRAYLSVEPKGLEPYDTGDVVAHVGIKNSGHLPATNVEWKIHLKRLEGKEFDPSATTGLHGSNIVAPGLTMIQGSNAEPLGDTSDRHYWYVWGSVRYDDGFEPGKITDFCHRYPNSRMNFAARAVERKFARQHRHGNRAT